MEYGTVEKTNYRSLLVTIWMNLKKLTMSERSHRSTYMTHFCQVQKQIKLTINLGEHIGFTKT